MLSPALRGQRNGVRVLPRQPRRGGPPARRLRRHSHQGHARRPAGLTAGLAPCSQPTLQKCGGRENRGERGTGSRTGQNRLSWLRVRGRVQEPGLAPRRAGQRRETRRRMAQSPAPFSCPSCLPPSATFQTPRSKLPRDTVLNPDTVRRHTCQHHPAEPAATAGRASPSGETQESLKTPRYSPGPQLPERNGSQEARSGVFAATHTDPTAWPRMGSHTFPCAPHDRLPPTAFLSEPLLSPQDPVMCPHSADL